MLGAQTTFAQIKQAVVGITPACAYGFSACWPGAREGLSSLEGVDSKLINPDYENCTAVLQLPNGTEPDLFKWASQFRRVVGQNYTYRGIEITMDAYVIEKNGSMVLQSPFLQKSVTIVPFRHKLQWDFQKGAPKLITLVEKNAYRQAVAAIRRSKRNKIHMLLTGPLIDGPNQLALELRTFSKLPE